LEITFDLPWPITGRLRGTSGKWRRRLFPARGGARAFPQRRRGGTGLTAGAAHAGNVEEAVHHAEIVSLALRGAASTRFAGGGRRRGDGLLGLARLRDRAREQRRREQDQHTHDDLHQEPPSETLALSLAQSRALVAAAGAFSQVVYS